MSTLLFEVLVEELPALSIDQALNFIDEHMKKELEILGLSFSSMKVFGTPRRLVLIIEGLLEKKPDAVIEILGPKVDVAFLENGELSKEGAGFLAAKGLKIEDAFKKSTPKGEVLAAKILQKGIATKEIIPSILSKMLKEIPFKKSMRWEMSGDTFARPIRSMLALFDKEYLTVKYADVISGDSSYGHRYLAPEAFKVSSIEQYLKEMEHKWVILSPGLREQMFLTMAQKKASEVGGHLCMDENLLHIVRNLMEYPFVILGEFDKKYLAIPKEILISVMAAHQKCFAVLDENEQLKPYFIGTAAIKPYDEKVFAKGNAKVIHARFEDGAYYFMKDQEKTLLEHAQSLAGLVFERELGTMADKVQRILKISSSLSLFFNLSDQEKEYLTRAILLSKADLTTGVVAEFPELQGVMGETYALLNKEPKEVGTAIKEHYYPRFASDLLPSSKISAIISIADKLDTIVGICSINKMPKGNKDPFAIRRFSLGIVRILMQFNIHINLNELISMGTDAYGTKFLDKKLMVIDQSKDFIIERARAWQMEKWALKKGGERVTSLVDSVFAINPDDLLDVSNRIAALFYLRNQNEPEFESLIAIFKRASNIVKKALNEGVSLYDTLPTGLKEPAELALLQTVEEINSFLQQEKAKSFYEQLFLKVNQLKPKLEKFFSEVMVMVDDNKLKISRLTLLNNIRNISRQIADFDHIK